MLEECLGIWWIKRLLVVGGEDVDEGVGGFCFLPSILSIVFLRSFFFFTFSFLALLTSLSFPSPVFARRRLPFLPLPFNYAPPFLFFFLFREFNPHVRPCGHTSASRFFFSDIDIRAQ